jgi:hypothetical protein
LSGDFGFFETSVINPIKLNQNLKQISNCPQKANCTYGIPLWGTASKPNIEISQRYQNKVLRATVNSPWYISNKVLHSDLKVPTIREEITKFILKYRDKITTHPNELASTLLEEEEPRRLKRFKPTDLTIRFS